MEKLRRLRTEKGLSQARLAARAELDPSTVNQIERGAREASAATLRKLADALGIGLADLLEDDSPKVEPPLPFSSAPSEAQQRLAKVPEKLGEYITTRAKTHAAELEDENSPHFRNATAAALWLAGVEREIDAWCSWVAKTVPGIMPTRDVGDLDKFVGAVRDAFAVVGARLTFADVRREARRRIEAMNDAPDALAARRLEVATAAAEASRKQLEDQREAASG